MTPEDSVPVDVISPDQLAKVMAGMKTGKKENPKPLVEKVAEAKPVDDAVGKITEKAPVVTETAPPPQPKVEEKPVEKKPDPPKVVEKPKEEPKPGEEARSAQGCRNSPTEKKPDPSSPIRSPRRSRRKRRSRRRSRCRPPSRLSRRSRSSRTALRSDPDRGTSRQARPVAPGRRRRHAEFQRRAWPRQGGGRGQFRDMGLDVQAAGPALLEEAVWRHRGGEVRGRVCNSLKRDGTLEAAGSGRLSGDALTCVSFRRARCARSSNASRIGCRRPFSRNGNISLRFSRIKSDVAIAPLGNQSMRRLKR